MEFEFFLERQIWGQLWGFTNPHPPDWIKAVLFVLSKIGLILISQNVMTETVTEFCSGDFAVWEAPASLKQSNEVILHIELKQSYCEILESVPAVFAKLSDDLEIFVSQSLSASAVPLLETDNTSPVCRYFFEKWPILMACIWTNHDLLAAFWDKILMFHMGTTDSIQRSTAWREMMVHSASSIALLLALFDVALFTEREKPSWID